MSKALIHIVQIADERSKSKEDHGNCNKYRAKCTEGLAQSSLYIRGTGKLSSRFYTGAHTHECRCTANQNSVNEYGEYLYQSLLGRMTDLCGRRGIGRRTYTCFITE